MEGLLFNATATLNSAQARQKIYLLTQARKRYISYSFTFLPIDEILVQEPSPNDSKTRGLHNLFDRGRSQQRRHSLTPAQKTTLHSRADTDSCAEKTIAPCPLLIQGTVERVRALTRDKVFASRTKARPTLDNLMSFILPEVIPIEKICRVP